MEQSRTAFKAGRRGWAGWLPIAAAALMLSSCAELEFYRDKSMQQEIAIQMMQKQFDEWEEAYNKVLADRQGLERTISAQKLELSRLEASSTERERELNDQLARAQGDLESARSELNVARGELNNLARSAKTQTEVLSTEKSALQMSVTGLQSKLVAAQREVEALRKASETQKNTLSALQSQLRVAQDRALELETEVGQSKDAVARLEKEARAASQRKTESSREEASPKRPSEGVSRPPSDPALSKARKELAAALDEEIGRGEAQVLSSARGVTIRLQSDYLFEPGTVIVSEAARPTLEAVAGVLSNYPTYQLLVEGHTDNQPVKNLPFADNLALSSKRAENVLRAMAEKLPQKRRQSSGSSSWMPIASNNTPAGQRQNRRVEISLVPAD